MDVSIIIVNYNTLKLTSECIESVIKNTKGLDYEIVLVDNASKDGSKEFFGRDTRLKYIYSDENLGFGRANNLGYKYCLGKYIFLLNSDTLLLNNAVYAFWKSAEESDTTIACFGSVLLNANGQTTHSYSIFPSICSTLKSLYYLYMRKSIDEEPPTTLPKVVDYVTGADLFIRRKQIEQLGLFNPDFFMYYEETELQYRYFKKGYKSVVISGPEIIHLEGASVNKKKRKGPRRLFFFTSMFKFMRKRYNNIGYVAFRIIAVLYLPIVIRKDNSISENKDLLKLFLL